MLKYKEYGATIESLMFMVAFQVFPQQIAPKVSPKFPPDRVDVIGFILRVVVFDDETFAAFKMSFGCIDPCLVEHQTPSGWFIKF